MPPLAGHGVNPPARGGIRLGQGDGLSNSFDSTQEALMASPWFLAGFFLLCIFNLIWPVWVRTPW